MSRLLDAVEGWTAHRFADRDLVERAFTHGSFNHDDPGADDYERLEFLGDGAVNLHAAMMLAHRFPAATNETLTDMRQRVVETMRLGEQGHRLGIDRFIRLGGGIAVGGRAPVRITGDVVEALFGALLVEGGFEVTRPFAEAVLQPLVDRIDPSAPIKKAVNRLQEFTQEHHEGALPDYVVEASGPGHALEFTATVSVRGEVLATGTGASKKKARERAAHLALEALQRRGREA